MTTLNIYDNEVRNKLLFSHYICGDEIESIEIRITQCISAYYNRSKSKGEFS